MALVRLRVQLLAEGDYFSMAIGMTPLPLKPGKPPDTRHSGLCDGLAGCLTRAYGVFYHLTVPQRAPRRTPTGSKRAVLQCSDQDDPWVECAKVRPPLSHGSVGSPAS